MERNNIFKFATGELSQDAFLCWCANWANFKDNKLYQMGKTLVEKISGVSHVRNVDIYRQYQKIDILLIINESVAVIIEDKIFTSEHDNQITRYQDILKQKMQKGELIIKQKKYNISDIKTVFLKTGNFYSYDDAIAQSNIVDKVINRNDMIDFVKDYVKYSEIANDYYLHLIELDKYYHNIEILYHQKNYSAALSEHWGQYYCAKDIFEDNKKMIGEFSDRNITISTGSSFGRPYTWVWLWGKENWYWVGYRIDCDNQGYFISLRLYRYYKSNEKENDILKEKIEIYENMKLSFMELTKKYGLIAVLGGNRGRHNESEIGKLYFCHNDIDKLKNNLYNIAEQIISNY